MSSLYAKLIVVVVIGPILVKLENMDVSAANTLKSVFAKAERSIPGLTFDSLLEILKKADISDKIDGCETLLRLGEQLYDFHIPCQESRFQELNAYSNELKHVLSKIPDQIHDRQQFRKTTKEKAKAIKKLLDAVNKVIAGVSNSDNGCKQILEDRKRTFVTYSKKFSDTLYNFFRYLNQDDDVFMAANYLVFQTNVIVKTVKQECCSDTDGQPAGRGD